MSKSRCEDPRCGFVSAFIACPLDQVGKFTGTASVVELGIKNLRDLEFGFIIDNNGGCLTVDGSFEKGKGLTGQTT